jgi:hypothetical protein
MKKKNLLSSLLFIIIFLASFPSIKGQTDVFNIEFNVDMTTAENFDPDFDVIYITGSMLGWTEPGAQAAEQLLSRVGTSMIWTKTMQLIAGEHQYKYFKNYGWMNGEWGGEPNRVIQVTSDMVINDQWGIIDENEFYDVTFNVDMSLVPNFNPDVDVVYITGSYYNWPMPGSMPDEQLMNRIDGTMIWTKTLNLQAVGNLYKYFINYGWDRGEWSDSRSRALQINESTVFDDYWANCFPVAFPLHKNFDDQPAWIKPDCWHINGTGDFYGLVADDFASSLPNSLRLYHGPQSHAILISPYVEEDLSNLQISFKAVKSSYHHESIPLILGVMTDQNDPSSFQPLTTFILDNKPNQPWQNFNYYFDSYTGSANYIAFKGLSNNPEGWYEAYIDDIVIDFIPDCPPPHNLLTTNITTEEALLNWSQIGMEATVWDVLYGFHGFDPTLDGTLIPGLNQTEYLLQGLSHSTHYDFYVRAYCDAEASGWSAPKQFWTVCLEEEFTFLSPPEGHVIDLEISNMLDFSYALTGCADFWVNIDLFDEFNNHLTSLQVDDVTGSVVIAHTLELPMAMCSGNYKIGLSYWNNNNFTWNQLYSPLFTVINNSDNVQIAWPNGWMVALTGQHIDIRWNSSNEVDVSTFYSLDNGQNWNLIAENVPTGCGFTEWGYNNYNWVVPTTIEGNYNESLIKVEMAGNPAVYSISNQFRITNISPVEITNPQQGDIYEIGEDIELIFNIAEQSWVDIYWMSSWGLWNIETFDATVGNHSRTYNTTNLPDVGYNRKFSIRHHNTGLYFDSPYFAILTEVPACNPPINVQNNATHNSAEISWINYGSVSAWKLEWRVNFFEPGDGNLITGIDSNPYTLSGLPQGSWITFYMQSDCGDGEVSEWVGPFSFSTSCDTIEVPYFENFDAFTPYQLPACWAAHGDGGTLVVNSPSHSTPHSILFQTQPFGSIMLITPEIDANISDVRVKFKAQPNASPLQKIIEVGAVPAHDQGDNFTPVGQFELYGLPGQPWQEFVVPFGDYVGNEKYIAIRFTNTHDEWQDFYLDDLQIEYLPACPEPYNLIADAITLNSAHLSWQQAGASTEWDLVYGLFGFDPATEGTLIEGLLLSEYEASGLNHSTFYEFYARRYCDGTASDWSSAGLFRTACGDVSLTFASPVGNEVFNTNQTSQIPVQIDFIGCEALGAEVVIVDEFLNAVSEGVFVEINATGTYSPNINIPNTICSGTYAVVLRYWDNANGYVTYYSAFFDIINDENNLEVRQPWQNQSLFTGNNYAIAWNSSTNDPVNLYYSLNNGLSWHVIMQNVVSNCGTTPWGYNWFNWLVPNTIEGSYNECLIKVSVLNNPGINAICETFNITSEKPLTFIQPVEGEIIQLGDNLDLVFDASEPSGMIIFIYHPFGSEFLGYYEATEGQNTISYNTTGWAEGLDQHFGIQHFSSGLWLESPRFAIIDGAVGCLPPGNIQTSNQMPTSVDISWLDYGGSSSWDLEWGINYINPGEGTLVSNIAQSHTTLSGLTPGSSYTFYLASNCDGGLQSDWVGPFWFDTPLHYTITAFVGDNGSISPLGTVNVVPGDSQSFAVEADFGYEITDILVDGVSIGALNTYTFENVTANHTITASFSILNFTINATADVNGSISPSGDVNVNFGQNQTFTFTPNNGYEIADVFVDGISIGAVNDYTFLNVSDNHTISATFSLLTIMPLLTISPSIIEYSIFIFNNVYNFSFEVKETGGQTALTNIDIFSSGLSDENGNFIPGGNFSFSPSTIANIPPGGSVTVNGTLITPAALPNPTGVFQGLITAQTNQQAKDIQFIIGSSAPIAFNVTGGGSFCVGAVPTGVSVGLNGSQAALQYQLFRNNIPYTAPVSGTGSSLIWNNVPFGSYTIGAFTGASYFMMEGSAEVIEQVTDPIGVTIVADQNEVCAGTEVNFIAYPENAGTSPAFLWNVNDIFTGVYGTEFSYTPTNGDLVTLYMVTNNYCSTNGTTITSLPLAMIVNPIFTVGVGIIASQTNVIEGSPVTITANPINGGSSPSFQWKVNGINIGSNTNTLTYTPVNNDAVSCELTASAACVANNPAISNTIIINVQPPSAAIVNIVASGNNVCAGTVVSFTASIVNAGTNPDYRWKVNGTVQPGNLSTFSYTPLNSDIISLTIHVNNGPAAGTTANSNQIEMTVQPKLPVDVIIASSSNNICEGTNITFTATPINGGLNPSYFWYINGVSQSATGPVFTYQPQNDDNVNVQLTSSLTCVTNNSAQSNLIEMIVNPNLTPEVTIVANQNNICLGINVTFDATSVNGGDNPLYYWYVNNINLGANNPTFTYVPNDGDEVQVILISDQNCLTGNSASSNTVFVNVNDPVFSISIEPEEAGSATNQGSIGLGNPLLLHAVPNAGWVFSHWSDQNGNVISNNSIIIYYLSDCFTTLQANFDWETKIIGQLKYFNQFESIVPSPNQNSVFYAQLYSDGEAYGEKQLIKYNTQYGLESCYEFNVGVGSAYTIRVWEEVAMISLQNSWCWNNWGGVSALDALIVNYMVIQNPILENYQWIVAPNQKLDYTPYFSNVADANNSNTLTALDALMLLYHMVNYPNISSFPGGRHNFQFAGKYTNSLNELSYPIAPEIQFSVNGSYTENSLASDIYYEAELPTIIQGLNVFNTYMVATGDLNVSYSFNNPLKSDVKLYHQGIITISTEEELWVPFKILNQTEIGSVTLEIKYDNSLIEVLDLRGFDIFSIDQELGIIKVAWMDINGRQYHSDDELLLLKIKVLSETGSNKQLFEILPPTEFADRNTSVISQVYLSTYFIESGTTAINEINDPDINHAVVPNPFSENAQLRYVLPESGKVKITIYNYFGQEIMVLHEANEMAGAQSLWISNQEFRSNGAYFYRIELESNYRKHLGLGAFLLIK